MKTTALLAVWVIISSIVFAQTPPRESGGPEKPPTPIALEKFTDPPPITPVKQAHQSVMSNVAYSRGPWISIQVNVDQFGDNIPGDAANETSLAIDPTNPERIAIGWRQFDTIASNFRQAGWGFSDDGGQSWTFPGVIEPGVFRSDPVLDADSDGNFYYYSLTTDLGNLWEYKLYKSTDGGASWDDGVFGFGGDKGWMVIDRTGGFSDGNIYAKWQTFFNCCGENTFARSVDGGLSFQDPIPVPLGPTFGTLSVGPDGEVYVVGIWAVTSQDFSRIVFARSSDPFSPFQSPTFELSGDVNLGGTQVIGGAPNPAGLLGQICVATDHSNGPTHGNVYMLASVDPPDFVVADPLDVKFIRSTDGGQTWSAPLRINSDSPGDAWQWFGTISVAPNGRIDVIWNDTRNSGAANISELFYAYSTNAGQTWSRNIPVSPSFDSHLGWPNQNKLGDYYDMISDDAAANVAYAATFNGEQDVYFLRVGDCNHNGTHDGEELADGSALDDNNNGVIDSCECPADLDGNGEVRVPDLIILLSAWGPNPGHPADLDGDGEVRVSDLVILLSAWGPCL